MKKIIIVCFFLSFVLSNAQVRMTNTTLSAVNSSAFIDASSNTSNNNTLGSGKGLVFPRVDLATFSFVGATGVLNNFPTRFDGMVVYNTKDGGTANQGSTQGTLSPGFWFYENKSATTTGGIWKPLGSSTVANTILSVSTASYTALANDGTLLIDVPSGGATVTLPSATTNRGTILTIKKIDTTYNQLTFNTTIKLSPVESFTTLNYPRTLKIQSDGTDWWLIN